jgi:hypothetical protein
MARSIHRVGPIIAAALLLANAPHAWARATYNLSNNNSSIVVNDNQQAAISSWMVDGVQQLFQLANFYRVGSVGGERSTHTLPLVLSTQTGPDGATVIYGNAQFTIQFDYGVIGGAPGSGYSRMGENVLITNLTAQPLEFHFFEYIDLDLSNTPNDDIGLPVSPTQGQQFDSQTIVNAGVLQYDHHEYRFFNPPAVNTLSHLTNGTPSTLDDQPPFGVQFGIGDITWSMQWDFGGPGAIRPPIAPFGTAAITKFWECNFIPEPAGAMLGTVLMIGVISRRRGRA